MTIIEKLKAKIKNSGSLSFAQIEEFFKEENFDFKGDTAQVLDPLGDTYIWAGWNAKAWGIVDAVVDHKSYGYVPCNPVVYLISGIYSLDPIAKRAKKYSNTHWLPVTINYKGKR